MISPRVSLSRDYYAAGVATISVGGAATVLFTPLNGNAPTAAPSGAPPDALPAIFADRLLVSNPGSHAIVVRPIIPGSTEAQEYDYPNFPGAVGGTGGSAQWLAFSPHGFNAAPADNTKGITVPAGAIAFPIEVVCIGLVMSGTAADVLDYAAYGSNKRA